jgi:hypothetical protein
VPAGCVPENVPNCVNALLSEHLHEAGDAGDATRRVTDAKQATRLTQPGVSSQFAKTEQGNFVIVDFDFINNGSDPVTLATQSLTVIDSEGRESNPDPEQFYYVTQDKQIFLENMNPGVTKHGETIFEVAPDASGFQLEVGDTNPFTDENVYVNLGFWPTELLLGCFTHLAAPPVPLASP